MYRTEFSGWLGQSEELHFTVIIALSERVTKGFLRLVAVGHMLQTSIITSLRLTSPNIYEPQLVAPH